MMETSGRRPASAWPASMVSSASSLMRPRASTGISSTRSAAKRWPRSTAECSTGVVSSTSQASGSPPREMSGVRASTSASVPDEVKTTPAGSAPTRSATCLRASSRRARGRPALAMDGGGIAGAVQRRKQRLRRLGADRRCGIVVEIAAFGRRHRLEFEENGCCLPREEAGRTLYRYDSLTLLAHASCMLANQGHLLHRFGFRHLRRAAFCAGAQHKNCNLT